MHALPTMEVYSLRWRQVAVFDNGTWAATAGKQIREMLSQMKNMEIMEPCLSVKSALKADQLEEMDKIVEFMVR